MSHHTWRERARYRFDEFMAKGTGALLAGLFALSALLVLGIAAIVVLSGQAPGDAGQKTGFFGLAWMGLLRTLDTGTMGGDEGSPIFLAAMLVVTLGGVFTVSTLIGILNNGLGDKLTDLRKGRSRVVEHGHTVILGWSDHIAPLVSELVLANANQPRSCIVILGDRDKLQMEEDLRELVGPTGRTKIVCRHGSPIDLNDLEIASVSDAKSIVVLSPEGDDPDASVIKTILAITHRPGRRSEPFHIVAEIRDPRNMDVARMVGQDEVELIQVGDLVSRIVAQTCRQSGLSVVYTELLDFGGDELYFKEEPALVGRTFSDALFAYEDSTVIGLKTRGGSVLLNPPMGTAIGAGDEVIAISEDDDTVKVSGKKDFAILESALASGAASTPGPERTLILGWNWRAPAVIAELDQYVAAGSVLTVVADDPHAAESVAGMAGLRNLATTVSQGDTTDRRVLDAIGVATYDHIVLLCYADTMGAQQADARTLVTLLHLRDMASKAGRRFSIVSEMLDIRNRALAEVARADDFIVSDRLVSLMLAQVAENKHLNTLFAELFRSEGSELYLKPATDYVRAGAAVNFYTVLESARRRGHVAIGYRIAAQATDSEKAYGVVVNPAKSATVTFAPEDRVVVLAEN